MKSDLNQFCDLGNAQKVISELQSKSKSERDTICVNIQRSLPAFILANFSVTDLFFEVLTDRAFKSEPFVTEVIENLKGKNQKINIVAGPKEFKKDNKLCFVYTTGSNSAIITWQIKLTPNLERS